MSGNISGIFPMAFLPGIASLFRSRRRAGRGPSLPAGVTLGAAHGQMVRGSAKDHWTVDGPTVNNHLAAWKRYGMYVIPG